MVWLTPWLTGAGSRRLEGTNISHEDAEGMAYVGVRVEPTVRLGREVEGFKREHCCCTFCVNRRRTDDIGGTESKI